MHCIADFMNGNANQILLEKISPQVDDTRLPVKLSIHEQLTVEATIRHTFPTGIDVTLFIKERQSPIWEKIPMASNNGTNWYAIKSFAAIGIYFYKIEATGPEFRSYSDEIPVWVEPSRTRFSTWYERFPRSCSNIEGKHATFHEFKQELQRIADLGFDTVYIPPISPIGKTNRKGKNGSLTANEGEPGSVWAIGNELGGHKSIDPQYGTMADFDDMVAYAKKLCIEIALDIALHCSPDHPYIGLHPEWFKKSNAGDFSWVCDGDVEYRDIIPFDFECAEKDALWHELKSIFNFWIGRGISIFRIDNPHTKPLAFWQWLIFEIKKQTPQTVFLSEALTSPDKMHDLAKIGMSQTYDYFQWKVGKREIEAYYTEMYSPEIAAYFKPVLWTNTPQNLPSYLQYKSEAAFIIRLILAGTLGASYGIYGPPFEYCLNEPLEPNSVEYKNSEQFEISRWNDKNTKSISATIHKLNAIRKTNEALQNNHSLRFHKTDNENVIAYSKNNSNFQNILIMLVSLDPENRQTGFIHLNLDSLGLIGYTEYKVHDLLHDQRYNWNSQQNYFELAPDRYIAHILKIE
jgi:starch synthase (maltosyl-transferring)